MSKSGGFRGLFGVRDIPRNRFPASFVRASVWLIHLVEIEDRRLVAIRARLLVRALLFVLAFDTAKQFLRRGHSVGIVLGCACLGLAVTARTIKARGKVIAASCFVIASLFVVSTFPTTANHGYATWLLSAFALWMLHMREWDRPAGLSLTRWLGVIIIVWSGAQKLLHGTYDHGEFLAYQVARHAGRFAGPLSVALPDAEMHRLLSAQLSSKYFQFTSWQGLVLSVAIPCTECILGACLLHEKTRLTAAWISALMVLSIQLVAGEVTFAMVMLVVLATFYPPRQMAAVVDVVALVIVISTILALNPQSGANVVN